MLKRPDVSLVDELHQLGRQLSVLKRLYRSYEVIMAGLLQRQRLLHDEKRYHRQELPTISSEDNLVDLQRSFPSTEFNLEKSRSELGGVLLSSAAASRFERLVDRIQLYCLSEIDACLTEKESLTFLVSRVLSPVHEDS
jgi:hypothetical protein